MGIKVGINGTVREVSQLKVCIGGVARTATNGYGGVGGAVRQFFGSQPKPPVSSIKLSPASAVVTPGSTRQFTATVLPADAVQGITWSLSGAEQAGTTISAAGFLRVSASETATYMVVRATATDSSGTYATASVCTVADPPVDPDPVLPPAPGTPTMLKISLSSTDGSCVYVSVSGGMAWEIYPDEVRSTSVVVGDIVDFEGESRINRVSGSGYAVVSSTTRTRKIQITGLDPSISITSGS